MEAFIVWLVTTIKELGYTGLVFLMAMESSVFPVPSELVIPPAGYLVSKGEMNAWIVLFAGTLGSLLGALFNYAMAHFLGRPLILKYGKYIMLQPEKFERINAFFIRHGEISTFSARFIPVVRHFISIPAGLAQMDLKRFSLYTTLGSGIWVGILECIGYLVGNNMELVKQYSHQVTLILLVFLSFLLAGYIYWQKKSQA